MEAKAIVIMEENCRDAFLDPASMLLFRQIILVNFGEGYWQMLANFFYLYRQFEVVDYAVMSRGKQVVGMTDSINI